MLSVALKMLAGDRAKQVGLLFGIAFASFLVTFAAGFFAGFMTRGFALVSENPTADVWVMDPATQSVDKAIAMPESALSRVRGVDGVAAAAPVLLDSVQARFPGGQFRTLQVVGLDGVTLAGLPALDGGLPPRVLREADAVVVDPGGTTGKLDTPIRPEDAWPADGPHLAAPTRPLRAGDELSVDGRRALVVATSRTLPRFPPRPLAYMTIANARRLLHPARRQVTFVMTAAAPGVSPRDLARRIEGRTGLRARSAEDFKRDVVLWTLANSEDVGDVGTMLVLAACIGFGVTGVLLFMLTQDALKQYAVLMALGATPRQLVGMVLAQAGWCGAVGTGLGLGACAVAGRVAAAGWDFPFRMAWFAPVAGGVAVTLVCVAAALVSLSPVLRVPPALAFARR